MTTRDEKTSVNRSVRHMWKVSYEPNYVYGWTVSVAVIGNTIYLNDGKTPDNSTKRHDDVVMSIGQAEKLRDALEDAIAMAHNGNLPNGSPYDEQNYVPGELVITKGSVPR